MARIASAAALIGDGASPVRVVLADGHALLRRSLRLLLEADGVEVVAEAGDLATMMRQVNGHRPRVLVVDLSMSDGSSIEAIRLLHQEVPRTAIVVLTADDTWTVAQASLDAGALGFVLTQAAESELPAAVSCAARGERYVSPRLAARV